MNTKQFNVALVSGPVDVVSADYFTVDRGALCFRNKRLNPDEYPETVTVFAPGAWSRVDTVPETAYKDTRTLGKLPEFGQ